MDAAAVRVSGSSNEEVLDLLVVGGGPCGTAVAFRAHELGLRVLVIDYDDLMKRIRDYAKDKLILPDYGGGDIMPFPNGGDLVSRLRFEAIDKDELCQRWKDLYREFSVPFEVGVEMTGLERTGTSWSVVTWNHAQRAEGRLKARHVVLAMGRGVPRRLDVMGDVTGLAFGLTDSSRYIGRPACVIGGGTSAAEAVIAISMAKGQAEDASGVYWSYRGDKMPKVSKALSEPFFEAFVGNGNIRYLPKSEPIAVTGQGDAAMLSIRTARTEGEGRPPESVQLEFFKSQTIACIGEEIPEPLLTRIGIPLVAGGPSNKKRIVVSPVLETRQANVYLAGDTLSPAYFETANFDDPGVFGEIKRRGNIKAALRDGVLLAEVVHQKAGGRSSVYVDLTPRPFSAARMGIEAPVLEERSNCVLVSILQTGTEANEFRLPLGRSAVIGRGATDLSFPDDSSLAERHASIAPSGDGFAVRDEGSERGTYVRLPPDRVAPWTAGGMVKAGSQWLMLAADKDGIRALHFDGSGAQKGRHALAEGTTVFGRDAPGVTLARDDSTLSRRHFAVTVKGKDVSLRDLGSANGTVLRVGKTPFVLVDGDVILAGRQVLKFTDDRLTARPPEKITFDTRPGVARSALDSPPAQEAPKPAVSTAGVEPKPAQGPAGAPPPSPSRVAAAGAAASEAPAPAAAGSAPAAASQTGPSVTLRNSGRTLPCAKGKTICEALEAAGIKIDADCHRGSCGMDPVLVLEGAEHLGPIGGTEKDTLEDLLSLQPGPYRLACTARVNGAVVVELVKSGR